MKRLGKYYQGHKTVPLTDMAKAFSGSFFRRRLDTDYVSHMREYMVEVVKALQNRGSFWQLPRE